MVEESTWPKWVNAAYLEPWSWFRPCFIKKVWHMYVKQTHRSMWVSHGFYALMQGLWTFATRSTRGKPRTWSEHMINFLFHTFFGLNFVFNIFVSQNDLWNCWQCRLWLTCSFRSSLTCICTVCTSHFVRKIGVRNLRTITVLIYRLIWACTVCLYA